MKKTIDEILNRNDYSRLTEQMRQRVEEIAERIHYKLDNLDIANDSDYHNGEIGYGDVVVRVAHYSYNDNYYTTLTIKSDEAWHTLERVGREVGFDDGNYIRGRATNNEVWASIGNCPVQVLFRKEYVRIRPSYTWQAEQVIKTARERKNLIQGFKMDLDGTHIILYRI